eukprot:996645-Amphidinium_carterae.1
MASKRFLECLIGKVLELVDMLDETVQSEAAAAVDGKQHWLLLMDLAPVHASAATVAELRKELGFTRSMCQLGQLVTCN